MGTVGNVECLHHEVGIFFNCFAGGREVVSGTCGQCFFCKTTNDACGGVLWRVGCVPSHAEEHVCAVTRMSRCARVAGVLRSEAVDLSHVLMQEDMTGC